MVHSKWFFAFNLQTTMQLNGLGASDQASWNPDRLGKIVSPPIRTTAIHQTTNCDSLDEVVTVNPGSMHCPNTENIFGINIRPRTISFHFFRVRWLALSWHTTLLPQMAISRTYDGMYGLDGMSLIDLLRVIYEGRLWITFLFCNSGLGKYSPTFPAQIA